MEWGSTRRALTTPVLVAALLSMLVALFIVPPTADLSSTVGVALISLALVSFALLHGRDTLGPVAASTTGPVTDAQCLRGAFRRQSNPDTPGRPRPRAPGSGHRPV